MPRNPQQLGSRRRLTGGVVVPLLLFGTSQIHQPRQQVGRGHAVGQGVVHLADESKPVVGHPLGEVELPQGAVAGQRSAGDLTDHLVEFAAAARAGYLHPTQVVIEVDLAVLHPHRVVQLPRDVDQAVPQRVEQVQAALDRLAEHLETEVAVIVRGVDDRHLQGVRMQVGVSL